MFSIEDLKSLVKNHNGPSPSGVSCKFIKINDEIGIKVYRRLEDRDRAFRKQKEMFEHGYAPNVGVSFEIDGNFCYTTQVVTPIAEGDKYYAYHYDKIAKSLSLLMPNLKAEMSELCTNMRNVGYHYYDAHVANFGWLNDKMVCIDFA